ncbi:MAG: putative sulfate exporter family transporter [Rikenellaceae bacterium]
MQINTNIRRAIFIALVALSATPFITAPVALVMGFIFANTFGHPYPQLSGKMTQLLLKGSVIGLGFGMNIHSAIEVGKDGIMLTAMTITTVLVLGYLIGTLLKMPRKLSHLTASGTAICGGSAIAAVAPAVGANESETSISLGVIFLLNSIALIIFPPLGHILGLSDHEFGMWCAMAIHDTSSVVGAASAYSEEALQIATTVKLARALWIIPISLLSAYLFRVKGRKIAIPYFIFLFIVAMAVNSYVPGVEIIGAPIYRISKTMLVVTLFLIGSSLSLKSMREVGAKPLVLGVTLWIVVSILSLAAIHYLQ